MAKLPKTLIAKPKPTVEHLRVGETAFISSADMLVTGRRDCFLRPTAEYDQKPSILNNLRVERKKDGFHVAVLQRTQWKADATQMSVGNWLPVATLIVDLDPDLDLAAQSKALERLVEKSEKRLKAK